ncbi:MULTISPECIES: DUF305 domain-containing protein [Bacteria]|uniref:DUF305 domain-containing protein n=1 Tax=Bacteria TaxID=2 RepID=UPI003C7C138B
MTVFTRARGAGVIALTLVLTGCTAVTSGAPDPSAGSEHAGHGGMAPATSSTGVSAADAMFVTMMIPHHQQAIEMADLVLGKDGLDARVADLAREVKAAQQPEIDRMRGWLADGGASEQAGMAGMDHGAGMMSASDMGALRDATGAEAGRLFLEQMIVHHEGAVAMAEEALAGALTPEVRALAQQVIDDQTAEIAEMKGMLAS